MALNFAVPMLLTTMFWSGSPVISGCVEGMCPPDVQAPATPDAVTRAEKWSRRGRKTP